MGSRDHNGAQGPHWGSGLIWDQGKTQRANGTHNHIKSIILVFLWLSVFSPRPMVDLSPIVVSWPHCGPWVPLWSLGPIGILWPPCGSMPLMFHRAPLWTLDLLVAPLWSLGSIVVPGPHCDNLAPLWFQGP